MMIVDAQIHLFWGTDITHMHCTWRECVTLFTEELPWLKGSDLELVMGQAFCDWIGWDTSHLSGRAGRLAKKVV
jgi:hypothetical protein